MNISLQGFNANYATFIADNTAEVGKAASIKGAYTVGKPTAVAPFIGAIVSKRDEHALVQMTGAITLSYSGTAPTIGYIALAADTAGNAVVNDIGAKVHVIAVDTVAKKITFII